MKILYSMVFPMLSLKGFTSKFCPQFFIATLLFGAYLIMSDVWRVMDIVALQDVLL